MKFYDFVTFVLVLTIVSVVFYWAIHWVTHRRKETTVDYSGFRGFLKWGYRLRWNMVVFALVLVIFNLATAPKFSDRSNIVTQINSLFT